MECNRPQVEFCFFIDIDLERAKIPIGQIDRQEMGQAVLASQLAENMETIIKTMDDIDTTF